MSNKQVKCRYSKCLHNGELIDKDKAVKIDKCYYHPDCYKIKEDIQEIVKLFKENINPNVVYSQLHKVINNIVFDKGETSDFLLFGLQYYIKNHIPLRYPQGLYYVIQNKEVNKQYQRYNLSTLSSRIEIKENIDHHFTYIPIKEKTIADIID